MPVVTASNSFKNKNAKKKKIKNKTQKTGPLYFQCELYTTEFMLWNLSKILLIIAVALRG